MGIGVAVQRPKPVANGEKLTTQLTTEVGRLRLGASPRIGLPMYMGQRLGVSTPVSHIPRTITGLKRSAGPR